MAQPPNSQSLENTDKDTTHIPKQLLQVADLHQMKTADSEHTDPRLSETRRLMMLKTSPDANQYNNHA